MQSPPPPTLRSSPLKSFRSLALCSCAALALVATACGSSKSSSKTTVAPSTEAPTTVAGSATTAAAGTIVDIASGNTDFSTLVAAVKAAGLAETLSGPGPFTVFAPTNEAFAKLPAGTLDTLLKPENKATLTGILTYHVLPGLVLAKDVMAGPVKTVNGENITVSIDGGNVILTDAKGNKSKVIKTDIVASNGVIHVIDTVLLP